MAIDISPTKAHRVLAHLGTIDKLESVAGNATTSIATVVGMPCAVLTKPARLTALVLFIAPDTFVPRSPEHPFLFDKEVNRYHLQETKRAVEEFPGNSFPGDGLIIKPVLVSGRLSAGLALPINSHPSVFMWMHNKLGRILGLNYVKTQVASYEITSILKLEAFRPSEIYEWGRPDFIADPTIANLEATMHTINPEHNQQEYIVTIPPCPYTDHMVVYFLRHDSDMAKCISHRQDAYKTVEGVGRVGICDKKFDYRESFSNKLWAVAAKFELPAKLASLRENIAVEGFYCTDTSTIGRNFIVSGIWDLNTHTRWDWETTRQKAAEWCLPHVTFKGKTTQLKITVGSAKEEFRKDLDTPLVFISSDGKNIFSQE